MVTGGPYARIRHPQYLFLALSGFGLLLYWPRFIVLIFYVVMLFVYYLLARNEEWRMKREQPGSYEKYASDTWMFLPGEPGGRLYRVTLGWVRPKGLGIAVLFVVVLGLSIAAAFGLRTYTVGKLPQARLDAMRLVSVYPRPAGELKAVYRQALSAPEVKRVLADSRIHLAYVMPGDFFLTGLILREGPRYSPQKLEKYPYLRDAAAQRHSGGLVKFFRLGYKFFRTIGTSRRVYDYERLVLVSTRGHDGRPVSAGEALQAGVRRVPVLVVDMDADSREVLSVMPVSGSNAWGRLPMPNF